MKGFGEDKKGVIDFLVGKLVSRKFLVWIVSSLFLLTGAIGEQSWLLTSLIWLGFESVGDLLTRYFSSKGDMIVQTHEYLDSPDTPPVITNQDDQVGI